jgi:lysophospholipase L1-like esterase
VAARRAVSALAWLLVLVLLIVATVFAEGLVRWRERHRTTPPGTMPTLYYRHERLRPSLIHDRDYFGWVHTDSLGLRGRPVALARRPGTVRILADGGSTTFDATVSADDSTWPAQLARLLEDNHGAGSVEVLNAGVPGFAVIDNLIRLQTELFRLKPDIIILLPGHNDLYYALVSAPPGDPTTPGAAGPSTPWGNWLARHSLLYGKLEAARRAVVATWIPGAWVSPGRDPARADSAIAEGADQFHRDLTSYVLIAKQAGARVILVEPVQVSGSLEAPRDSLERTAWENAFAGVPADVVFQGYAEYRRVMRQVAEEQGIVFIATGGWGVEGAELYDLGDPIHLVDEGARRFAEHLAGTIDSLALLEVPSAP